jgi:hypothetical protein
MRGGAEALGDEMSAVKPEAMGNCGDDRERMFDPDTDWTAHSGIGCATTLPMTDEERAAVKAKPIGFVWSE